MKDIITKITVKDDIALVNLLEIPGGTPFIGEVFGLFSAAGVNIDMISLPSSTSDRQNLSFTVFGDSLEKTLGLAAVLREEHSDVKLSILESCSKIMLYGEAMRELPGVAHLVFKTLADAGAPVHVITTSETEISLLLPSVYADMSIAALGQVFDVAPGI